MSTTNPPLTYPITRTGDDTWTVDGKPCLSRAAAVDACMARDEAAGVDWDLSMPGMCQDGLDAIAVGASITVDLSDLIDEDEDEAQPYEPEARTCEACSTGTLAGPIHGTLANGERCDTCQRYTSDAEAREAIRHHHDMEG